MRKAALILNFYTIDNPYFDGRYYSLETMDGQLQKLVEQWLSIDHNETTRREIETFVANKNTSKLKELLESRIQFGTAGLRARMEAGFARMNDVTVVQASQGLAAYIKSGSAVVGHDHRHNSKRFAQLTALVFGSYGFKVYFVGQCATPMVPYSVDRYKASVGIMVTASHNPKDDNGYKVYWKNGCQIIPPLDSDIQLSIMENLDPQIDWDVNKIYSNKNVIFCHDEVVYGYSKRVLDILQPQKLGDFKYVYTAMHGVGFEFVKAITELFTDDGNLIPVKKQCSPDPDFPTVAFPNPEEKDALNLALCTANANNVDLVLANDPDADRFSVAYRTPNGWRQLSGNEIGILFADYVVQKQTNLDKMYMINSTVSSQMPGSMADKLGFGFVDTLTGFKWIGNKAIELEKKGYNVPFAFEEAIGFMFPVVHDKDGISALVVFLQLYNKLLKEGIKLGERLEQLYSKYGYFKQCNGYYITTPAVQDEIFNCIRSTKPYPSHIGKYQVNSWRDLTMGYDSDTVDHLPTLHVDPSSHMITCKLLTPNKDEFIRFTVRGSGTEPKLKVYIEAKAENENRAESLAEDVWITVRKTWFTVEGLTEKRV